MTGRPVTSPTEFCYLELLDFVDTADQKSTAKCAIYPPQSLVEVQWLSTVQTGNGSCSWYAEQIVEDLSIGQKAAHHVSQRKSDMRLCHLPRHYGEPGIVAPSG